MKCKNSLLQPDKFVMNSKIKTSRTDTEGNTIESVFQDGGDSGKLNVDRTQSDLFRPQRMENAHVNSVHGGSFGQSTPEQPSSNDSMAKINENMPASQMANYNGGFTGGRGFGNDQQQHGGMVNSSGEYPPHNVPYNQYNQQNMRPNYQPSPGIGRGGPPVGRGGMVPQNFPPNQRGFMSGASIQQQGGPTPTLNQLLQNANPGQQRYQTPYPDYSLGQQKGMPDTMNSNSQNFHGATWNNQQRPMNPYQMQQGGGSYRSQGQMYDSTSRVGGPRSSGPGGPVFSQQSSVPGPGPGGQYSMSSSSSSQPFSPSSSSSNSTPRPPAPYNMTGGAPRQSAPPHTSNFNQMPYGGGGVPPSQQPAQSFNNQPFGSGQHSPAGTPGGRGPSPSPQQQPPPSAAPSRPQPSPSPASTTSSTPQQQQAEPSPQHPLSAPSSQECSVEGDEAVSDSGSATSASGGGGGRSRSTPTPTSTSQLPPHRPTPSPAGSSTGGGGSRSNTPASITGSQAGGQGSPMPPRPPSNQLDGQQSSQQQGANPRIHSPMSASNQGYGPSQTMMPPPPHMANSGPMSAYGNSNKHMVPPSMAPPQYSQQYPGSSPHPQQGNMLRGPGPYSSQNSGFGGPQQAGQPGMGFGGPPVNSQTGGPIRGPMMPGYNQYNQNIPGPPPFNAYNQQQPPPHQSSAPPPSMPPASSNQPMPPLSPARSLSPVGMPGGPVSPGPKGAQAAAQAALIAAASQSSIKSPHRSSSQTPPQTTQQQQPMPSHSPRMPHMNHVVPSGPMHPNSVPSQHPYPPQAQQHSMTPASSHPGGDMMGQHYNMSGGRVQTTSSMHNNMPVMNNVSPDPPSINSNSMHVPMSDSPLGSNSAGIDAKVSQANNAPTDANSTLVTQSIRDPLTNATESELSSPSSMGTPTPMSTGVERKLQQPPTPKLADQNGMDTSGKKQDSHPPTPSSLIPPSPAASQHNDDFENISSPSWPGTPKPAASDVMTKMLEMGEEVDRRSFLDRLFTFMDERSSPITVVPAISKQPVDLYRLYHIVKEKGGMVEVTKNKKWRDVSGALSIGSSSSAGFTLRKNYAKYLFAFECRFDLGNVDPAPILASLETPSKKDSKRNSGAVTSGSSTPDPFIRGPMPPGGPVQQNNQQFSGFPGQAPPQRNMVPPGPDMQGGPMMPPNVSMMPNAGSSTGSYDNNQQPQQQQPQPTPQQMGIGGNMPPGPQQPPPQPQQPQQQQQQQQQQPRMLMPTRPPVSGSGLETVRVQDPFADAPPQYPHTSSTGSGNMPYPAPNMPNMPPSGNSTNYYSQRPQSGERVPYAGPDGYNSGQRPPMYPESSGFRGPTPSQQQDNFNPPSYPPNANRMTPNQYTPQSQMNNDMYDASSSVPGQMSQSPSIGSSPQPSAAVCTSQQEPSAFPNRPYASQASTAGNTSSSATPSPSNYGYGFPVGQRPQGPGSMFPMGNRAPAPPHQQHPQKPPYGGPAGQSDFRQDGYSMGPHPPNQQQSQGASSNQSSTNVAYPPSSFSSGEEYHPPAGQQQQQPGGWGPPQRHNYPPHSSAPHSQQSFFGRMPPPSPMSSSLQQRMSSPQAPRMPDRYGYQPNTPSRPLPPSMRGPSHLAGMHSAKKDIVFPSDSVEATIPHLAKRRRLTHKDLKEKVDPWRLLLALRSGLITESTWALDVLSILLYDDHTVVWFALQHLPGLLDVLLLHLRQCLIQMFGCAYENKDSNPSAKASMITDGNDGEYESAIQDIRNAYCRDLNRLELEKSRDAKLLAKQAKFESVALEEKRKMLQEKRQRKRDKKTEKFKEDINEGVKEESEDKEKTEASQDAVSSSSDKKSPGLENIGDDDSDDEALDETTRVLKPTNKLSLLLMPDLAKLEQPDNYTYKTRTGRIVKLEMASADHLYMVDDKSWDELAQKDYTKLDSHSGYGDDSSHIMTHLESCDSLKFQRKLFFGKRVSNGLPDQDKTRCRECMPSLPPSKINKECEVSEAAPVLEPASPLHIKAELECEPETVKPGYEDTHVPPAMDIKKCCETSEDATECDSGSQQTDSCSADDNVCSPKPCLLAVKVEKEEEDSAEKDTKPDEDSSSGFSKSSEDVSPGFRYLASVKRKWSSSEGVEESEAYQHDPPPLSIVTPAHEEISRRAVCISNIIRSLSFIPVNGPHLSKHSGLLLVIGKLLLLHHHHPKRRGTRTHFEHKESGTSDAVDIDSEILDDGSQEWWWDTLEALRENVLVVLANISGHLNLNKFPEDVCMPILDGLLHWAVCPSACARDSLPSVSSHSSLSYHRLVLESMCKLCVTDENVDLLLATPPFSRLVQLLQDLTDMLADKQEQVMREFAIVLLSSLVSGDSPAARIIALHHPAVSLLLDFIEWAEQQAQQIVSAHGRNMLCDNPEMMGTSLDMLRRASSVLRQLALVPENKPLLVPFTPRILTLLMSHVLDQNINAILAEVLFLCSQNS